MIQVEPFNYIHIPMLHRLCIGRPMLHRLCITLVSVQTISLKLDYSQNALTDFIVARNLVDQHNGFGSFPP